MVAKITRVPLWKVWPHEALDFTPWLLDNLDALNDALPFELIAGEREVAAGTSWVDIVAKEADGGIVTIENQLGTSDHGHLGKVFTHLAEHGARRSIWIVRDARPEHIKAIDRWNELGQVEFFLVKVEAVKIGTSEPAAMFTKITGPSAPLRTAGDTKRRQVSRKSRSLMDVIDECKYFDKLESGERRKCRRMLEAALALLRKRTGAETSATDGRQSHSASMSFLDRHPRLLKCVRYLFDEDQGHAIGLLTLSAGQSSAMLYMMGSSSSDGDLYRNAEPPSEKKLDWGNWDKACEFWRDLANGSKETKAVAMALDKLKKKAKDGNSKLAVIIKAWNAYANGKPTTAKTLALRYKTNKHGVSVLTETPVVGGIDVGEPDSSHHRRKQ